MISASRGTHRHADGANASDNSGAESEALRPGDVGADDASNSPVMSSKSPEQRAAGEHDSADQSEHHGCSAGQFQRELGQQVTTAAMRIVATVGDPEAPQWRGAAPPTLERRLVAVEKGTTDEPHPAYSAGSTSSSRRTAHRNRCQRA
jgi:hypothetical protein